MVCKISKRTKKGFTLTEMIIVIAIIVILAGAGLTGVIVSLNDYKRYRDDLEENGGYKFEADARDQIEGMLQGGAAPVPDNTSFPDPPTPTPVEGEQTSDTSETSTEAPPPSSEETTTQQNNSGGVPGSNISNSNSWTNGGVTWHQPKISLPSSTDTITFYLPGNNPQFNTFGNAKVEPLGNNQYRLKIKYQTNSFDFQVGGVGAGDVNKMYVVSMN